MLIILIVSYRFHHHNDTPHRYSMIMFLTNVLLWCKECLFWMTHCKENKSVEILSISYVCYIYRKSPVDLYETKNGQKGTIINNTINRLILAALKYKERHYNENDEAFRCYVYCG